MAVDAERGAIVPRCGAGQRARLEEGVPRALEGCHPVTFDRILTPLLRESAMRNFIVSLLLVPSALLAQAQPAPANAKPGWKWSMDTVRAVVNAVRAGRSLQPNAWPNGARVAVLLSFDVDNETVALRFGDPNPGSLSQGQYGSREGLARVLKLLDRYQIPATFFVPSVSLALAPEMAGAI